LRGAGGLLASRSTRAREFAGCTVAPGFDFADFEMPPCDELAASFPEHYRIIRELTRR
jgi:predicted cupin superfamily sugar epimerase